MIDDYGDYDDISWIAVPVEVAVNIFKKKMGLKQFLFSRCILLSLPLAAELRLWKSEGGLGSPGLSDNQRCL